MSVPGSAQRDEELLLYGRSEQLAAIDRLLEGMRSGRAGSLVLRGEAGIGKTALLDAAEGKATGARVLRVTGVESEAELPFAGLQALLRPAVDEIGALPERQAVALRGAFGLAEAAVADRFLVGLGVLSLVAELAEDRPVLMLVDDAQWLDRASADALVFAARRLHAERAAVLAAARDEPSGGGRGWRSYGWAGWTGCRRSDWWPGRGWWRRSVISWSPTRRGIRWR
jgi:predicted ATPase